MNNDNTNIDVMCGLEHIGTATSMLYTIYRDLKKGIPTGIKTFAGTICFEDLLDLAPLFKYRHVSYPLSEGFTHWPMDSLSGEEASCLSVPLTVLAKIKDKDSYVVCENIHLTHEGCQIELDNIVVGKMYEFTASGIKGDLSKKEVFEILQKQQESLDANCSQKES